MISSKNIAITPLIQSLKSCFVAGLFLLFFLPGLVSGQVKATPEYQLKAAFIFNFTRFIDWPAATFSTPTAPFVIGVLGDDPFGNYLDEIITGETTGGHPIVIQHYASLNDVLSCHVLFINAAEAAKIKDSIAALSKQGTLTVSDADNFAKWGGVIRFFSEHNKIRIQINLSSAKTAQLNISSKLLGVSQIFNPPVNP